MSLPVYQTDDKNLQMLQNQWKSRLDPLLSRQQNQSNILQSVSLVVGDNSISHGLGKKLSGWSLTRIRAASVIYDKQDSNKTPELTLDLNSSAAVVVDLEVF